MGIKDNPNAEQWKEFLKKMRQKAGLATTCIVRLYFTDDNAERFEIKNLADLHRVQQKQHAEQGDEKDSKTLTLELDLLANDQNELLARYQRLKQTNKGLKLMEMDAIEVKKVIVPDSLFNEKPESEEKKWKYSNYYKQLAALYSHHKENDNEEEKKPSVQNVMNVCNVNESTAQEMMRSFERLSLGKQSNDEQHPKSKEEPQSQQPQQQQKGHSEEKKEEEEEKQVSSQKDVQITTNVPKNDDKVVEKGSKPLNINPKAQSVLNDKIVSNDHSIREWRKDPLEPIQNDQKHVPTSDHKDILPPLLKDKVEWMDNSNQKHNSTSKKVGRKKEEKYRSKRKSAHKGDKESDENNEHTMARLLESMDNLTNAVNTFNQSANQLNQSVMQWSLYTSQMPINPISNLGYSTLTPFSLQPPLPSGDGLQARPVPTPQPISQTPYYFGPQTPGNNIYPTMQQALLQQQRMQMAMATQQMRQSLAQHSQFTNGTADKNSQGGNSNLQFSHLDNLFGSSDNNQTIIQSSPVIASIPTVNDNEMNNNSNKGSNGNIEADNAWSDFITPPIPETSHINPMDSNPKPQPNNSTSAPLERSHINKNVDEETLKKLEDLEIRGFTNRTFNLVLLNQHKGNVDQVVMELKNFYKK